MLLWVSLESPFLSMSSLWLPKEAKLANLVMSSVDWVLQSMVNVEGLSGARGIWVFGGVYFSQGRRSKCMQWMGPKLHSTLLYGV